MRSAVARAANLIIDHSGSGKPLGWLPAPHRKLCHFGANLGPHGAVQSGAPAMKRFHAAKTHLGGWCRTTCVATCPFRKCSNFRSVFKIDE